MRSFGDIQVDLARLPRHIGIIMDGNGRWARARGLLRTQGHRAGSKAVRAVVRACRSLGIANLTLYAFSAQNWGRPEDEVRALMSLLSEFITREWRTIMERDIRVVHLGEMRRVPAEVRNKLKALLQGSRHNRAMTLALALSYGSREEITRTARLLAARAASGSMSASEVDERVLAATLYTHGLPDPDLIIRTGGEQRVSNFLLWQSAYAEIYFTDTLWPDFKKPHLLRAIAAFQQRQRRFGLTDEQVAGPTGKEER